MWDVTCESMPAPDWGNAYMSNFDGFHLGGINLFYDVNKTLTHNALINMVIGPRGVGKTFALKCRAIDNFIKKDEQFIYLRRYQTELDLIKKSLFNDVAVEKYPELKIEYGKGDVYTINDEIAGYAMNLSRSNYYKSASFPDVSLIIFDEFIIDTSQSLRYLKNETRKLLDFIETIFRMRDNCRVFMLANSLSFINPYSLYWKLKKPKNSNIAKSKNGLVLCELVQDSEFFDAKRKTKFGQLIEGTDYEAMAVNNEFILDSETFIQKKSGNCSYLFTFTFHDYAFGLFANYREGLYFVSYDIDPSCPIVYSTTTSDHGPNKMLFNRSNTLFRYILNAYKQGILRFENQEIKSMVMEVIGMFG